MDCPQVVGQGSKLAGSQLYTTQAEVASHDLLSADFAAVQLASDNAALPSLPLHSTARVSVDSEEPQSVGHAVNSAGASQLYATHAAVSAQTLLIAGFATVQLDSAKAKPPSLPIHCTVRVNVV